MTRRPQNSLLLFLAVVLAWGGVLAQSESDPLDESCTVSILNRTVRVRPDGTWVLPNVPSGFGRVRARATCVRDGVTSSGQSDFFDILPGRGWREST